MDIRRIAILSLIMFAAFSCGKAEVGEQGGGDGTSAEDQTDRVCVDAPIVIVFSSDVVLGTSGVLKVFDGNDRQVDIIDLKDAARVERREDGIAVPKSQITSSSEMNTWMDAINCGSHYRVVHYSPLEVSGKKLTIWPHSGVFTYDTDYYLTMDKDFVKGFAGAKKGEIAFKTKSKPSSAVLSVKRNGKGDFCTVQGAINYAASLGKDAPVTINVASGNYPEMLYIRDKNNLTIKGASRGSTSIFYANSENYVYGTGKGLDSKPSYGSTIGGQGGRSVILVESCSGLRFESITLKNTFGSTKGQAEVIYFNCDNGTLTVDDCELSSLQDTFLCKGDVMVRNSVIAGHCDFIWGYPRVCVFENCEIRAMAAGYVVQARVNNATDKGFIFRSCRFTAAKGVAAGSMYIARSGGDKTKYDNVTLINCTLGSVIAPSGWYTSPAPNPSVPTATSGWKEYGSVDENGAAVTSHNAYGKVLTAEEAKAFM